MQQPEKHYLPKANRHYLMDLTFDTYEEEPDATEIHFTCTFDGAIPSKQEVLDQFCLCFSCTPEAAEMRAFRPVKRKRKIRGSVRIRKS